MKILIICAADRSKHFISLNIIKYLVKLNIDDLSVYVLDRNKNITSYLIVLLKKTNMIGYLISGVIKYLKRIFYQNLKKISIYIPPFFLIIRAEIHIILV